MRRLLLVSFLGVAFLALAVSTIPFAIFLQSVERERLLTSLERDAFVLAGRAEEALESLGAADLAPVRDLVGDYRDAGGARVVIVDSQGSAVVTNDPEEIRVGLSYVSRPEFEAALGGVISTGERFSDTLGITLVYVAVPVFSGPEIVGAVRLTFDKAVIDAEVNRQWVGIGLVALITLALGAVIAVILSGRLVTGIRELSVTAGKISAGDFTARAREDLGPRETQALAGAFNNMAGRVGALVEQRQRFATDASHQLRTPITAIMLRLERLRDSLTLDAKGEERFDAIDYEIARLTRLIDGLLALGRSGVEETERVEIDATSVARERVESWRNLADEAGVRLISRVPEGVFVVGVATSVEQILDVFLDNALSVSPPGSTISVDLESHDNTVSLCVHDEGPGMAESDLPLAFERFWRGGAKYEGTGLGLALVKQLADVSGATVSLGNRSPHGLTACVMYGVAR